jgi:ABC-2 type transport system ATP-binding protein
MSTMTPTVTLSGTGKAYGRTRALHDVQLQAGAGVTAVLGRNGAGKTTLMRVLATVLSADSGTVRLLRHDPADPKDRVLIRQHLGYLPQEFGFYRSFTVFNFVDYIAILKQLHHGPTRRREVWRVLELLQLADVAHKRMRVLSGGMRRRVGLAQTLLGEPRLLVLDEPAASLDAEQQERFRNLATDLGLTVCIVMSTHQTHDLTGFASQVVVLDRGRIRFAGPPETLTATARGRVWISDGPSDTAVAARTGPDGGVRNLGVPPPGADLAEPTLEDAYRLLLSTPPEATAQ